MSRAEAESYVPKPVVMKQLSAGDLDDYVRGFSEQAVSRFPIYSVAVFVFCHPDSAPARELRRRREYFDLRTGDTWDVFFPGYYQYGSMNDPGAVKLDEYWSFSPRAFDAFRRDLERKCDHRWRYSGGSDLVLVNVIVQEGGVVTVDFDSVLSGPMTDSEAGTTSLTLAQVIEAMSTDLESSAESPTYGVSRVVGIEDVARRAVSEKRSAARETAVAAAGAILGEIGSRMLGLKP